MSWITRILAAAALVLASILASGCAGKAGDFLTAPAPASISAIAGKLVAGPVDQLTQESYYLLTDDQRIELLASLRRRLTDGQIKSRSDVYAIVGYLYSDTTTARDAALRDQEFRSAHPTAAQEYIAVGGLPQYSQRNSVWSGIKLGYSTSSTIGAYGCYLTVISDLLTFWGTGSTTPSVLNGWSYLNQAHYAFAPGTDLIKTDQAISYPNLCRPWSTISATNYEAVRRQLRAGHPVVVHTTWGGGHFMLVYCWDGSQFWVVDPWPTSGNLHPLPGYGSIYEFRLLGYNPA